MWLLGVGAKGSGAPTSAGEGLASLSGGLTAELKAWAVPALHYSGGVVRAGGAWLRLATPAAAFPT